MVFWGQKVILAICFYSCSLRLALLGALGEDISDNEIASEVYRYGLLHCYGVKVPADGRVDDCML